MAKMNQHILKLISQKLTKLVKNEIIKQKRIVTGKMLKETEAFVVTADEESGELIFAIESTDYFKFVDGRFEVLNNALNIDGKILTHPEVIQLYEDLYSGYMEDVMDESIPEGPAIIKK